MKGKGMSHEVERFAVLPRSWSSGGFPTSAREGKRNEGQKMKTGEVVVQEKGRHEANSSEAEKDRNG